MSGIGCESCLGALDSGRCIYCEGYDDGHRDGRAAGQAAATTAVVAHGRAIVEFAKTSLFTNQIDKHQAKALEQFIDHVERGDHIASGAHDAGAEGDK